MSWAADRGEIASKTIPDITKFIHASSGMRLSVMPGHRMEMIVAMMLMAVAMLPKPAKGRQPKAEGIQAGKRHVSRANHQWHKVVGKAEQDRHGDKENHCCPM